MFSEEAWNVLKTSVPEGPQFLGLTPGLGSVLFVNLGFVYFCCPGHVEPRVELVT